MYGDVPVDLGGKRRGFGRSFGGVLGALWGCKEFAFWQLLSFLVWFVGRCGTVFGFYIPCNHKLVTRKHTTAQIVHIRSIYFAEMQLDRGHLKN